MIRTFGTLDPSHRFEWSHDSYDGWLEVPLSILRALDFTPTSELSYLDIKRGVVWLDDRPPDFNGGDLDRFAQKWEAATGVDLLYNYNKLSTDPRCPAAEHPIRQFPIFSLDLLANPA